jgi:hypothetical protein
MEPAVPPVLFARQPEAKLSDPEHLRRLSGTYQLGGTRVVVSLSGHQLMIAAGGGQPVPLLPGLGGEFVHSQAQGTSVGSRRAYAPDSAGTPSASRQRWSRGQHSSSAQLTVSMLLAN